MTNKILIGRFLDQHLQKFLNPFNMCSKLQIHFKNHHMVKWYSLNNITCTDDGKISADIKVKPDSPWFSGHFPDNPILPGIAQLAMVFDTIKQGTHKDFKITNVQKVRFKQIVRPGDQLKLTVQPISENLFYYSFRIMVKGDVVCTGTMLLNRRD